MQSSKFVAALCVIVLSVFAGIASAEITRPIGVSASLGYSHPGQSGLGVTGSAYVRAWILALYLTVDVTAVGGSPNEDYRSETFSNGQTVCRDLSNGQFAEKHNCGGTVDSLVAGMAELHLSPASAPLFVGAGIRTSPAPGPFVVAGYLDQSPSNFQFWFLRGALGRGFGQVHVGLSL